MKAMRMNFDEFLSESQPFLLAHGFKKTREIRSGMSQAALYDGPAFRLTLAVDRACHEVRIAPLSRPEDEYDAALIRAWALNIPHPDRTGSNSLDLARESLAFLDERWTEVAEALSQAGLPAFEQSFMAFQAGNRNP